MSNMHHSTYDHLKPTDIQMHIMYIVKEASKDYSTNLEANLPDGPDKIYILRKLREIVMWCNVAITRLPDGTPRS